MQFNHFLLYGLAVFFIVAEQLCFAEVEWPHFRGPTGQGIAASQSVPLHWSETENVAWKAPLDGKGWSSPVVMGNQVWLTSAHEQPASEEEAAERSIDPAVSHLPISVLKSVALVAVCIDRQTGELIREIELFQVDWPDPIHSLNSFASPTPTVEAGRAYFHFGTWGTACLDTQSAEVVWQASYPLQHMVGPGSSPVLHDNRLILTCDGADQQFTVALDTSTGAEVWRTSRPPIRATDPDYRKSFCTPIVIDAAGRSQIISPGAQWLVSYDPTTGDELWRMDHGDGFSLVAAPVFDGEHLFFTTGFGGQTTLLAVRVDGQGDVTESHVDWKTTSQAPIIPSPLLTKGLLFTVSNGGVATCLDATTGEKYWQKRIGGNFCASPVCVNERIFLCDQDGRITVLAANQQFERLARNELGSRIMASPAVLAEGMLIRTEAALYLLSKER